MSVALSKKVQAEAPGSVVLGRRRADARVQEDPPRAQSARAGDFTDVLAETPPDHHARRGRAPATRARICIALAR
eukprot:6950235-Lingulodinium_polyedra.AAC.1